MIEKGLVMTVNENQDIFNFLDDLREDGSINMFGAAPVLVEVFGLGKHEARAVLSDWMKNFK